jgi:hypothetical protein
MTNFKKLYVKLRIKLRNLMTQPEHYVEEKKYTSMCVSVAKTLISLPDSELIYTPQSYKYYIKNVRLGIYMVINNDVLSVTNHSYSYEVKLSGKSSRILTNNFDYNLEKRGQEFDLEMIKQIKESLSSVYQKLENQE